MLDFGYDVMNYRDVDPMFGTLGDFDARDPPGARARAAGDDRPRVSATPPTSTAGSARAGAAATTPRPNWYVWADAKPDGTPPNNWLSIFGGSAWEWDSERLQYYQHNFLKEQPDLNFHEPEVQDELLAVARFWLERGVDGFRLDTINFYFCDASFATIRRCRRSGGTSRRRRPSIPTTGRSISTTRAGRR